MKITLAVFLRNIVFVHLVLKELALVKILVLLNWAFSQGMVSDGLNLLECQ